MDAENRNIIGQREVIERLMLLDREDRIPHAMLFTGPQGVGKMAVALEFAKHLLKKHDPFGNAEVMVDRGSHPDLIFSFPVVKPNGMDRPAESDDFKTEWLEMLQDGPYFNNETWLQMHASENKQSIISVGESNAIIRKLSLKSSQGGYKVCLIWQAEKMNLDAANKLLKIIEEPPTQTVFILMTEHPEQVLETIRSRTQRIDFKPISEEEIAKALVERRSVEESAAKRVARASGGSWLQAMSIISGSGEREEFHEVFKMLMRQAYAKSLMDLKQWSESVSGWNREKQRRFLEYCLLITRENFMFNFHDESLCYMTPSEEAFAAKFARFINERNVIDFCDIYNTAIRDVSRNANSKIVFYDLALKVIILIKR